MRSPLMFFRMSKYKTLAWAVFCVGMFILSIYANFGPISFGFLAWALILGLTAAYKFNRDRGIITQAKENNAKPQQLAPPAMTSKGSSRLFVPDSSDRQ